MNTNENKKNISKITIGIDTNITAIGCSYTTFDDNNMVVDSHLQTIKLDSSNADSYNKGVSYETPASIRRANRSVRHNRTHIKIVQKRLVKYLESIGLLYNKSFYTSNMNQLKVDGLQRKLTQDELTSILFSYTKNRGYFEIDEVEIDEKDRDYKKNIQNFTTTIQNSGLTISEYIIQKEIKLHDGHHIPLSIVYKDELAKIWKNQIQYPEYSHLSNQLSKITKLIWFRFNGKSYRNFIGECKLETSVVNGELRGRKVSSASHPSYESFSTWATIHNLRFGINGKPTHELSNKSKELIYNHTLFNETADINLIKKTIFNTDLSYGDGSVCLKSTGEIVDNYDIQKPINLDIESYLDSKMVINIDGGVKNGKFTTQTHTILVKYGVLDTYLNIDTSKINSKWVRNSSLSGTRYPSEFYSTNYRKLMHDIFYIITSNQNIGRVKLGLLSIFERVDLCDELVKMSFNKDKGKLSLKAIERMLPHMNGDANFLSEYNAKVEVYGEQSEPQVSSKLNKPVTSRDTRNYMVADATNHVIKYISSVMGLYGHDINYDIKIELGRNVCSSKEKRKSTTESQKKNEKLNNIYADIIKAYNSKYPNDSVKVNFKNRLKVKLFIEQIESLSYQDDKLVLHKKNDDELKKIIDDIVNCKLKASVIYNDNKFNITELFTIYYEVEHTLTKSKYHSDANLGLTICDKDTNSKKGDDTAHDYIMKLSTVEQQKIKSRLDRLYPTYTVKKDKRVFKVKHPKREYFDKSSEQLQEFLLSNNQLTINSYMAKFIADKLRGIYNTDNVKFYFSNGVITNTLKTELGVGEFFNKIILKSLSLEYKFKPDFKFDINKLTDSVSKRFDDRHHALDAFIISLVNPKYLHNINNSHNENGYLGSVEYRKTVINDIMKYFGLSLPTKDNDELKKLHSKIEGYLEKCVVVSSNKYNDVKFQKTVKNKNGGIQKCDGVVGEIHEQKLYGKVNDVYTTRESFLSLYKKASKGDKFKDVDFNGTKVKIATVNVGGVEYLLMEKKIKNLLTNGYKAFKYDKNTNTLTYQNSKFYLPDYIGVTTNKDGKDIYYDIKFLETFYNSRNTPNTLGVYRLNSLIALDKNAKVEQIRLDGNGKPVYAYCTNKTHINVIKDNNGNYKYKTVSLNTFLKTGDINQNDNETLIVKIKKNDMFIIGLTKNDILNKLNADDYTIYDDLYYVNGFTDDGYLTMLKHNISGILGNIKNVILGNKTQINGVSKITINNENLKTLKCLSRVKFNNLGEIQRDCIEEYIF